MYHTEKSPQPTPLVDYIPAELRENKTWEVVYYALDPESGKLKIKRHRVRKLKNVSERRKLARRMVHEVNRKLMRGWNPFVLSGETKSFTKFSSAVKIYLSRIEKQVNSGALRPDTLRAYGSYLKNLETYIGQVENPEMFCIKLNEDLVRDFIDHIYYERNNSARTRNNYLKFLNTFSDWMVKQKYLSKNPTVNIELARESKKKRTIIKKEDLEKIFNHLKLKDKGFLVCCMVCYYCLVRRTEMTKLKVSDVYLENNIIHIPDDVSKNKKGMPVTIPESLLPRLIMHLSKASPGDYLFSKDFKPGKNPLNPKKISDSWARLRKTINLPSEYQWYSLKDTGITNLLKAGVPLIVVRNQARHHSSEQTDAYTPKDILLANESIKKAKI